MDTKPFLNDEELTAVAGGNQRSMNQWTRSVEVILCQLEKMAANASAAGESDRRFGITGFSYQNDRTEEHKLPVVKLP